MKNKIDSIRLNGFIDEPIDSNIDLVAEINRLKKEKNAIILAHFYQSPEIQDIADVVGDSLLLAQKAAKSDADILVVAGVHFMAETAKLLSPDKKVLIPDKSAGCSLADSCNSRDFSSFLQQYPQHTVISYVNTTAAVKVMTDIVCTSSNAVQIVNSLPKNEKIVFAPDSNLGNYINSITGRNMVLWDGACHVHQAFSLEKILNIKEENPDAKILAHPECNQAILLIADHVGSTLSLLNFSIKDNTKKYIIATESGIIHQMQKINPNKVFIPAPPEDSTCGCNECNFMRLHNLKKLYLCLKHELPEMILDPDIIQKAVRPINRMLQISAKLGL